MPVIVKPISANLTKDADGLGKADPYCIIWIGQEKQQTQAHKGAGKQPQWTDTLQFQSTDSLLRIQVWDDDTFSDDLIGEGTVNLNQLYGNPNRTENQYIDLVNKGKSAGRVLLSLEYQGPPMGGNQGNQGWNQGQQQNWGNQGPQQSGWNQGQQGPQQGWGNQGPNQGWGNQGPQQSGWNQGPQQSGWNQGPPQQGWGNQGPNQQQGWGNQGPNQQQGWGNQPNQQQGWGNQPNQQQGWGNQGPNQGNQGNQGWGSGW